MFCKDKAFGVITQESVLVFRLLCRGKVIRYLINNYALNRFYAGVAQR